MGRRSRTRELPARAGQWHPERGIVRDETNEQSLDDLPLRSRKSYLLLFNGAPQQVDRKAEITPTDNGFSVDLSPVVIDQVKSAQRHFKLNPDRSLTIRDTWSTGETAANVTWQWLTLATALKTDDGYLLKQSGEFLHLKAKSDSKFSFEIEDVSAPQNKFDSPNPGLSRLRIRLDAVPASNGWIEVTASIPK